MNEQSKSEQSKSASPEAAVGQSVETLHSRFGNLASEYAKVRAETAKDAGEESDAVHWKKVEKSVECEQGQRLRNSMFHRHLADG